MAALRWLVGLFIVMPLVMGGATGAVAGLILGDGGVFFVSLAALWIGMALGQPLMDRS